MMDDALSMSDPILQGAARHARGTNYQSYAACSHYGRTIPRESRQPKKVSAEFYSRDKKEGAYRTVVGGGRRVCFFKSSDSPRVRVTCRQEGEEEKCDR